MPNYNRKFAKDEESASDGVRRHRQSGLNEEFDSSRRVDAVARNLARRQRRAG